MPFGFRALPWLPVALSCAFSLALLSPRAALAEPTAQELASARATFAEGKELEKNGDWASALEKFKKVAEVRITPQVRFHIALCEENLGKLVSAIRGFELAAEDAKLAGSSAIEVADNAPRRAEALRKRVAHLRIEVTGTLLTSKLMLDGVEVPRDKLGAEQIVDPGSHTVDLQRSGGGDPVSKTITLAERGSDTVSIEVHDEPPQAVPVVGEPVVAPPPKSSRLPAYVVAGVGVAGLVTSGILMGVAESDASSVEKHCKAHGDEFICPTNVEGSGTNGQTLYNTSLVVGGIGVAAVATGAVLFFVLGPKKPKAQPPVGAHVTVQPTWKGLAISGSF